MDATHRGNSHLLGGKVTYRTNACYARSPSKGDPNGRPSEIACRRSRCCDGRLVARRSRLLGIRLSQDRSPGATKALHATKDCSGFTGLVGAYCTIRSSNVKELKVGSKIFYIQVAGKTFDRTARVRASRAPVTPPPRRSQADSGGLWGRPFRSRPHPRSGMNARDPCYGAAPESNRPSRGLHDRTGFEDLLGHRAHAAPWLRLPPPSLRSAATGGGVDRGRRVWGCRRRGST